MIIKGIVKQIIKPKEIKDMIPTANLMPIMDFENKAYLLNIVREDCPEGYFKSIIYQIRNRKETYFWTVAIKDCNYKIGDIIELAVEPYYQKTRLYLAADIGEKNEM